MDRLDDCLRFVLRWEGGYVNHPNDPGGATNKGVTQRTFDSWRLRAGKPRADVRTITDEEVHAIYAVDYWLAARCDTLPAPLDLVTFDTAVNMGVGRAVRFLQRLGGVAEDGDFGPLTRQAVADATQAGSPQDMARSFCYYREQYYEELVRRNAKLAVFLKGWMNRLNALRAEAAQAVTA